MPQLYYNIMRTYKTYPVLALSLSTGLLIGAWLFQYGFGYMPCQMCYWQRYTHMLVIGLAIMALVIKHKPYIDRSLHALIIAAFILSAGVALWHVGVEYKWWIGPQTCSGTGNITDYKTEDLLATLDRKIKPPACTDIIWSFLGLSMAGWNMLFSFLGAGAGGIFIQRTTS